MDYSVLPAGLGSALATMEPMLHRLDLFIRKRSLKKQANEKLKEALTAIEEMQQAIKIAGSRRFDLDLNPNS